MGNAETSQLNGGGGGGGNPPSVDLSGVLTYLKEILAELVTLIEPGQSKANTYVFATATTTPTPLFSTEKKVKKAVIQNLSITDNMTVSAQSGGSGGTNATLVAGKGTVLNKAPGTGQGGNSLTVGNIDLSTINIITDTNAAQTYSVYAET
jgi:hypothetical protein